MRTILAWLLLTGVLTPAVALGAVDARPNIVLKLTGYLGWSDLWRRTRRGGNW